MSTMYMANMNMCSDATWYAPACQSAQSASTNHSAVLDTACVAVSFLSLVERIGLLRLVRIMLPDRQS